MRIQIIQDLIDLLRGKEIVKKHEFAIHPKAVSHPSSMKQFTDWLKDWSTMPKAEVVFEIGANYAQDAEGLRYYLGVNPAQVYVFEAHPDICAEIPKLYPEFNVFNNAIYNENKDMYFNVVNVEGTKNSGISSLLTQTYNAEQMKRIKLDAIRMDTFIEKHNIRQIDFLKLDVEGCNFEVLEGFGDYLNIVKSIHIEAEHEQVWENQKLYHDIQTLLVNHGFEQVYFQRFKSQSDSFWVKKEYIKRIENEA